jgi:hypothetical protein
MKIYGKDITEAVLVPSHGFHNHSSFIEDKKLARRTSDVDWRYWNRILMHVTASPTFFAEKDSFRDVMTSQLLLTEPSKL